VCVCGPRAMSRAVNVDGVHCEISQMQSKTYFVLFFFPSNHGVLTGWVIYFRKLYIPRTRSYREIDFVPARFMALA